jgi:importin-4
VLKLVEHSFEGVRKGAINTLWTAYTTIWGLAESDGMPKWKPGFPLQVEPTEDLKKLGDLVMSATLAAWETEIDR